MARAREAGEQKRGTEIARDRGKQERREKAQESRK